MNTATTNTTPTWKDVREELDNLNWEYEVTEEHIYFVLGNDEITVLKKDVTVYSHCAIYTIDELLDYLRTT